MVNLRDKCNISGIFYIISHPIIELIFFVL